MPMHDIVVIGGSAGALTSLRRLLRHLPPDLPAALFVVIHTSPETPSVLPTVLGNAGPLSAGSAVDGAPIRHGHILVAPPDHHLLVERGHVRVTRGPRENRFRPAVDPLFRTAAAAYGARVIGIILSGGQDDGVLGLAKIKGCGGIAIVQDPSEAEAPGMPDSALRTVEVDHVLRAEDMAAIISGLVRIDGNKEPDPAFPAGAEQLVRDVAEEGDAALRYPEQLGPPTPFRCPECGGALWELRDGELIRFHCHVGHAYNSESLVAAQSQELEGALWTALRALEDSAALRHRMADHARERGMTAIATAYDEQADDSAVRADVIRRTLVNDVGRLSRGEGRIETNAAPSTIATEHIWRKSDERPDDEK